MGNEITISTFTYTVKPRFTDSCLIRTPHFYGQFALSLGKGNPYMDTFYDRLNVCDWYDCADKNVVQC